jgi:fumarylacetoacetate (FAA) hydrolase
MLFTFPQMIERASADATLYPGDVLAAGRWVWLSAQPCAEEVLGPWLQPHDRVDLEVTGLGVLRNTIQPLML